MGKRGLTISERRLKLNLKIDNIKKQGYLLFDNF